ncbi:unnamed protein product [Agarophyton chilense]
MPSSSSFTHPRQVALRQLRQLAAEPSVDPDPDPDPTMSPPAFLPPCALSLRPGQLCTSQCRPPPPSSSPRPSLRAAQVVACERARHHHQPGVDFYGIPNPPPGSALLLSDLRERLIRQEETIIFALIERAQFKLNDPIYTPGAFDVPKPYHTFSQFVLYQIEQVYAKVRRYTSPDEHPFSPPHLLPTPILTQLDYPKTLKQNNINVNEDIEKIYNNFILQTICQPGDDQNYGSSATSDVACLQALSKRIHYGKFIAESKCQADEPLYRQLASKRDRSAIWDQLSNEQVERVLLKRVENKARSYGSDISVEGPRDVFKVDPITISEMYKKFIIPLTKEVEVEYVIQRYEGVNYEEPANHQTDAFVTNLKRWTS